MGWRPLASVGVGCEWDPARAGAIVARVFKTSEAVNVVLWALIAMMPSTGPGPDKQTDS